MRHVRRGRFTMPGPRMVHVWWSRPGRDGCVRFARAQRHVRAAVRGVGPARGCPRAQRESRRGGRRPSPDAGGAPRAGDPSRGAPEPVRARAVPHEHSAHPARCARPRRAPLHVLRRCRQLARSCGAAQPRWRARVGERRRRLRALQPAQGRPVRTRAGLAAARHPAGAHRGRPGACSAPGGSTRGGSPTWTGRPSWTRSRPERTGAGAVPWARSHAWLWLDRLPSRS